MRDLLLLPRRERGIEHRVDCKVRLAPAEPGGRVVEAHHDRQTQGRRVDSCLQPLGGARLQDVQLHVHTTAGDARLVLAARSEERRVGKEGRSGWWASKYSVE